MRLKILSIGALFIGIFTGFAFFLAILFYFIPQSLTKSGSALFIENVAVLPEQEPALSGPPTDQIGLPTHIRIPRIDVDAFVEYVGVTPDGAMDVPKERANVAWFNLGSRPGENGSAVFAGHYGWKNGKESVFDNLYKLRKGDKLYIEDEKGVIVSFVVRESRRYDPNEDASGVFNSSDGKAHLNLITCEGDWNKDQKSYSNRLVVFTTKE